MSFREARPGDALASARRALLIALAAEIAVLALTGIWLVFNYRPTGAVGIHLTGVPHRAVHVGWIRATHRGVSALALITSVGAGSVIIVDAFASAPGRRKVALLVIGPTLVVAVAGASFTGYLLPWNQLALWAVSVSSLGIVKGYQTVFGPNVRFVLVGHSETSPSTLWRWFLVHCVVLTVGVAGLLGAAAKLGQRRRSGAPNVDDEPAPPGT